MPAQLRSRLGLSMAVLVAPHLARIDAQTLAQARVRLMGCQYRLDCSLWSPQSPRASTVGCR